MTSLLVKRVKTDFSDVIARGYLTEQNVGVTEFIGKQKPFIGILKHRFEDFVVHEINPKGEMVKLLANSQPEDLALEEEEKEAVVEVSDLKLDESILESIRVFAEDDASSSSAEPILVPTEELAKDDRTKVHAFIRQNYPKLDSKTETINGKGFIRIVHFDGSSNPRRKGAERRKGDNRSQKRLRWPKGKPSYVHFVLYKENMETVQVVNELSRALHCTPKNFTFAGTKDKRAISTQMFAAWKTNPLLIWKAVQSFNRRSRFHVNLAVGHFTFEAEPLKLGDLSGNHFEILLRHVRLVEDHADAASDSTSDSTSEEKLKANVAESLESVKSHGFLNYFGMQRFGSHKIDSHKLGILILKREFKQLVNEILVEKPIDMRPYRNRNETSFNEAIRIWRDTGDAATAYKKLNYKYTIEGSLLRALGRVSANDYHGALCIGLLRNSRLLYLHAYQSYLWNRVASFRFREHGLEVAEGDLVFVGPDFVDEAAVDEDVELLPEGEIEAEAAVPEPEEPPRVKANIPSEQIILVTAENRSQFTIYDVVLPIIGGLSKFPTNSTKQFIDQILIEDGVKLADFASLNKQWCVNGSYRKLVVKPSNFTWEWKTYVDDTVPLIETDLTKLQGKKKVVIEEKTDADEPKRERNALALALTLPTSSYATVFLREVTKLSSLALENKPWQSSSADVNEKLPESKKMKKTEEKKTTDDAAAEMQAAAAATN